MIADSDEPAVAAITIAELGVGVETATGKRRQARRAFLDDVVDTLPIIGYDLDVARAHTQLLVAVRKAGRPRGAHDLIIAATAVATGRNVITYEGTGFDNLPGVIVCRPTGPPSSAQLPPGTTDDRARPPVFGAALGTLN